MERNTTEATAEKSVAVYRAYDVAGQLLYVGTSMDPERRMSTHRRKAQWWSQHAWYDVHWFPSPREASTEERRAIEDEKPRFNIVGIKTAYAPHWLSRRRPQPVTAPGEPRARYLSIPGVAERAGLSKSTVKSYSQIPGRLPEPDAVTGRVKGWLPETIDAWIAGRKSR